MEVEVDHYVVLSLPSGEEGARLSEQEINKAYRSKARELHPDKRRDDPNAHADFLKLQTSYEVLKDDKTRKLFDDLLRVKREKLHRQRQHDFKRQKMMSDLEERERYVFATDPSLEAQKEEQRISQKLKEEIARIRDMHSKNKMTSGTSPFMKHTPSGGKDSKEGGSNGLNKDKVLKVSWERIGEEYTSQRLREIFEKFGVVEDVVIKSSKKKGSALVVMASKDCAVSIFSGFQCYSILFLLCFSGGIAIGRLLLLKMYCVIFPTLYWFYLFKQLQRHLVSVPRETSPMVQN